MTSNVAAHYGGKGGLADVIADHVRSAGRTLDSLATADLASIDEFHIRGKEATLELAERMNLGRNTRVLDLGSGLGGRRSPGRGIRLPRRRNRSNPGLL